MFDNKEYQAVHGLIFLAIHVLWLLETDAETEANQYHHFIINTSQ